jgi:hypothetical protein
MMKKLCMLIYSAAVVLSLRYAIENLIRRRNRYVQLRTKHSRTVSVYVVLSYRFNGQQFFLSKRKINVNIFPKSPDIKPVVDDNEMQYVRAFIHRSIYEELYKHFQDVFYAIYVNTFTTLSAIDRVGYSPKDRLFAVRPSLKSDVYQYIKIFDNMNVIKPINLSDI